MKIAFIVTTFPELSETFILNQIIGLIDLGYDIEIFAEFNPHRKKIHPDVEKYKLMSRTHFFNIPNNKILRILKALYLILINFHKDPIRILKVLNIFKYRKRSLSLLYALIPFLSKKFDIVHCHFGPNGIIGVLLKSVGISGKYITSFYGYDVSSYVRRYGKNSYKELFEKGDLFLPISEYMKNELIYLSCPEEKVIIQYMGIDISKFKFKSWHFVQGGKTNILTIARLVEKKGLIYSIKAVARVIQKYSNIEYKIVGDGPLKDELINLIKELKAEDKIKLLGSRNSSEIVLLLERSHIFLLSSVTAASGDMEGMPVSIMEAQAMGLPVISTYHSGIPELIQDGKSGFLVSEKDVDALAQKIEYLIEHPEIWPEMGKVGREFVEKKCDTRKLTQNLTRIYQGLIIEKA